jgi:hypothetical protein
MYDLRGPPCSMAREEEDEVKDGEQDVDGEGLICLNESTLVRPRP